MANRKMRWDDMEREKNKISRRCDESEKKGTHTTHKIRERETLDGCSTVSKCVVCCVGRHQYEDKSIREMETRKAIAFGIMVGIPPINAEC